MAENIYDRVTETIISQIEAGAGDWKMPWHAAEFGDLPVNVEGRKYSGINTLILWGAALEKGYESNVWGTYKAWLAKGAQVRKGERATHVVYYARIEDKKHSREHPGDDPKMFMLAKAYVVFNAAQVDGFTMPVKAEPVNLAERIASAESFFATIPAKVNHGGNRAYCSRDTGHIQMPTFESFKSPEDYYSTRAHESGHWSGHESRLNREFGKRFGDSAYAFERIGRRIDRRFPLRRLADIE